GNDAYARSRAGDAEGVVDVGRDDTRNVGSVTVRVDATVAARRHVVLAGKNGSGEVLVAGQDSGVDDRDLDPPARGDRPGRLERGPVERPLLVPQGVVRAEGLHGPVALDAEELRA